MFKTSAWVKKHHDKENASAEKKSGETSERAKKKRKREASLSQDKHAACADWTEAAEL